MRQERDRRPGPLSVVHRDVRRAVAKRFPYCVYFRTEAVRIVVLAVFHSSRNPAMWRVRDEASPLARREAGYQLDRVQRDLAPDDWKPMPLVGAGVREIRIRDANGAFRVIHVAKFAEAIYVLHCFQKKSQKTAKGDIERAANRYRELTKESKP